MVRSLVPDDDTSHLPSPPDLPQETGSRSTPQSLDAIDHLIDGYYELDRAFRYRRVNAAGLRMAGKSAAEFIGKHVFDLFPDVAEAPIHQAATRVMESRQAEIVETYYPPHRRWYVNSIYPLGEGIAIFSRDISEQKTLEQNLSFLVEAGIFSPRRSTTRRSWSG